jgi:predicted TIM-barrel fold metal-dependent hydrolase
MPTADAHVHLFSRGFAGVLGESPAGGDEIAVYERLREHHGIERAVVVGYEAEPRYAANNAEVIELARTRRWIAPLAYLPVRPAPAPERLRELRSAGAAGFAVYLPSADDGRAFGDWPAPTFAELRAQAALISFNAGPAGTVAAVAAGALDDLDGCVLLFSHLGLPGRFAAPPSSTDVRERLAALLRLAGRASVAVKLSGLYAVTDPPHDFPHAAAQPVVDVLLEAFGPSRLVWGSDFSPALDFVSFAQAADPRWLSGCSAAEVDDVMGGNLLRLLNGSARED